MKFRFDGYNHLVRLEKGELLMAELTKLIKEEKITGAWVSGLGAAIWAELGYYDLENKQYKWKRLDQLLEITSLQGNIAWNDSEPVIHIHGTFSDEEHRAIGGHIKELEVGGTCELLLHRWYQPDLKRRDDPNTGLTLLDL